MIRREPVDQPPLIVHIVFRFDYGGLENGVANIVNALACDTQRHAIIAISEVTNFARRLRGGVQVFALGKKPGKDPAAYFRLYRLLRRLRPAIVHTRNVGTIDCALVAFLAGVPIRIHGEHGWDVFDPDGTNAKYRWMRKVFSRFVHRFVTVSVDLREWLISTVGISQSKVTHICNGVDTHRFRPSSVVDEESNSDVVVGSVTRFSAIKDPLNLVRAFIAIRKTDDPRIQRAKLVMIGDGALHQEAKQLLHDANLEGYSWLPGSRDDIPERLRSMDVFVLASLREGISNTILEAMASGLPIVASKTGGNPELVVDGATGCLVPPGDSTALAKAIGRYILNADLRAAHGSASIERAVNNFSIAAMVSKYAKLYASALATKGI